MRQDSIWGRWRDSVLQEICTPIDLFRKVTNEIEEFEEFEELDELHEFECDALDAANESTENALMSTACAS